MSTRIYPGRWPRVGNRHRKRGGVGRGLGNASIGYVTYQLSCSAGTCPLTFWCVVPKACILRHGAHSLIITLCTLFRGRLSSGVAPTAECYPTKRFKPDVAPMSSLHRLRHAQHRPCELLPEWPYLCLRSTLHRLRHTQHRFCELPPEWPICHASFITRAHPAMKSRNLTAKPQHKIVHWYPLNHVSLDPVILASGFCPAKCTHRLIVMHFWSSIHNIHPIHTCATVHNQLPPT